MIKVQFDHQVFSMHRFGGVSRYFAAIQDALRNEPDFTFDPGILYTTNYYLRNNSYPLPKWLGKLFLSDTEKRIKWNKRYSKTRIKKNDFDVFHPTYYNPYFLRKLKGPPYVLTVHDMIHELFPEFFPPQDETMHLKRVAIENASHFIAVSQSTANDLQKFYNIPEDRITVIHHGHYPTETDNSFIPPYKNYLLFVGERGAYKNFFRFLEAAAEVLKTNDVNLVVAGGKAFSRTEQEFIKLYNIEDRVSWIAPTDGELNQLYANATLFVYPSLYEGFGIPILEAFSNNCPVAVSNTSCFAEVSGDAVVYFDPYDTKSITDTITTVLQTPGKADTLRAAGLVQLQKFPLSHCLQKTVDVYRMLAAKGN